MNLQFLKKIRVTVSIIFFVSFLILFFDLTFSIQSVFSKYPLYLQFIPSFQKFLEIAALSSAGFIFVIILTLLFGRVYCSTICPLGILQDIFIFLQNKKKKNYFSFRKPFTKTRNAFLIVTTLLLIFGISLGINLLDPYSNFGRILANIFRPVSIHINNVISYLFEKAGLFIVNPIEFLGINTFSFLFSIGVFGIIIYFSVKFGRLYCNTICPVGTLLGYISKISFFKISVIESNCISCGECETVCKANCIESENQIVDFDRCIGCFNCFNVCPSIGISYIPRYAINKKSSLNSSRRNFVKNVSIFLFGSQAVLKAQKQIEVYKDSTIPVIRHTPISPPGSISIEYFNQKCTACNLCIASCPTQVLEPSFLEYGILEIMQPRMDYSKSFCNYDCTICTEVCPTGAILIQNHETKRLIQIGKTKFVKDNCVVYTQKTDCGACAEHCPTKAVKMEIDPKVNLKAPVLNDEICIGCGACEHACPTKPYKSIYVEGNSVHRIANKPKTEKLEEKINLKEEFPF